LRIHAPHGLAKLISLFFFCLSPTLRDAFGASGFDDPLKVLIDAQTRVAFNKARQLGSQLINAVHDTHPDILKIK
jgi:hypothetical protein